MTILDKLAEHAKERVLEAKRITSLSSLISQVEKIEKGSFAFEKAIYKDEMSFICECKKASPSKGVIAEQYDPLSIAKEYERIGADCVSVLTEPKWFLGSNSHLKEVASTISLPCIRKDFIVDEYMIYEARTLGAEAILLICSILTPKQIKDYIEICDNLGIAALVETHDIEEAKVAIDAGSRLIGINNRNLKDFSVNMKNTEDVCKIIPKDIAIISESGIKEPEEIKTLDEMGIRAVLIGETFMRASDKQSLMNSFKGYLK